ncbi:MAG: NADH-quinone oxidoreductase subunit J [Akkermansia sp.]|nr:NADH-quinone oxidoreductase subunit J [Akkermansia sp.]
MDFAISSIIFYAFAAMALICACCVIFASNPVTSAMSMALCFAATAGILFGLGAQFLGIVQIIVYAGAILVLFLFVVMMLDIKTEEEDNSFSVFSSLLRMAPGVLVAGVFGALVFLAAIKLPGATDWNNPLCQAWNSMSELCVGKQEAAPQTEVSDFGGALPALNPAAAAKVLNPAISEEEAAAATSMPDTKLLGQKLFSQYNIAFVILSFALLAGTVGAVALSRKIRKD